MRTHHPVLVIGAGGFIGTRLVPLLMQRGYPVRSLVRNEQKAHETALVQSEIVQGDVSRPETLARAFAGVDTVFYLVHSMSASEKEFEKRDRAAALNVVRAAEEAGVKRIVYLGGLGRRDEEQSPHLRSRHEVGDIFRSGTVPTTEFRAGVVLGSGNTSFEMVHHLVNRLPVMICPRWVIVKTQPIAVDDVLFYLVNSLEKPETAGRIIDIGGPEVLSYRDMMLRMAAILGLRRFLLQVPLLTPRLSSYWVNLVTPIPSSLVRILITSLRHETICEHDDAAQLFGLKPLSFEAAVRRALPEILPADEEQRPVDLRIGQSVDPSHLLVDRQVMESDMSPGDLFSQVSSVGGETGWYYADWLWELRGIIDKMLGGKGLQKGRRHPTDIIVGDTIDFWRVIEYDRETRRLRLQAETNVWGCAWLEFQVNPLDGARSKLVQTARYYPRGLKGLLYWWGIYPIHRLVFRNMARALCRPRKNSSQRKSPQVI